ncbi:MAG: cell wall-binding repeat-containing protein, partial [Coriobacteriia bacterium]|nr:cell wall-binding repeat-containing protein [Coriobacteriia bacterium]
LNSCGQLGDGTGGDGTNANDKNAPVQVGTDRWVAVSAGGSIDEVHSLGIKDDGSLWAWGRNGEGQLGDGTGGDETDANDKNAPVQVGTDRWRVVSAGNWHSLGIKEDGTLWAWGHSGWGRLGIGSSGGSNSKNAPAKIGADKWRTVSAGQNHSFGIKEDGTLWAWGVSSHGQLGIGASGDDKIERSPVPIGAETDRWRTASAGQLHSFGIKRDGTLWAWGVNSYGHLGDGTGGDETDANDKNAPVQVGAGAGRWITVSAGNAYSLGIKGDGSLWAWGSNSHGRLGIGVSGTSGNKNVPTKADGPPPLTRIFGTDRFATSIEASRANFGSADAVIIATGMGYADALSASALAGTLNAPLLLTRQDSLSPGVLGEIERLDATKAYIIGSEAAVSSAVEASLASAGLSVERVAGADRYATSAAIASRMAALESAAFAKKAFLARGDNFADGLAVSPLAYNNRYPVVLTRPTELPAPAATAITNLGIADITILGSEAAVSAGVEATVKRLGTSPTVRRVAGPDRYRTAQEIAKHALDNSLATKRFVGVATGLNFPDALAGGAAAGEREGILVLTAPDTLSVNWVGYLPGAYTGVRPDIQVYGGSNVVSESVFNTIKSMLVD